MRIGIICYPTYGGSGAAATDLGQQLAARGHEIHILSSARPFRLANEPRNPNLHLHQISRINYPVLNGELYTLATAVNMSQLVKEHQVEILHSHYAVPHAVSAWLARELCHDGAVKIVTTLHGTDITLVGSDPGFAPVVEMGIRNSDAVVSVSQWLADQTQQRFGLENHCQVIYNFVDSQRYSRSAHSMCLRTWYARPEEKVILHISNFREVKRTGDVVRIFARIVKKVPSVLLLVGDGPTAESTLQLARDMGVIDQVRFLGLQGDVASLLSIGDLFLFPSAYESFGLAVLEAMSCEVPVICSNGGGLPEVMVQGETGYLCDVGDVDAMAERGIEILKDESLALKMGKAGRHRAVNVFNPEIAVNDYEKLYANLLSR